METRLDHHGHKLLEEELAGVGDPDLDNLVTRVTQFAVILRLSQIGLTEETALLADVDTIAIRNIEETFLQESGRAMRYHAVTFHLSESQTTITSSSLSRLTSENLSRTTASGVDLVTNHMLQSLIVGRVEEDHDFKLLSSKAVVHDLVSISLVAKLMQLVRNEFDCLALEWSCITLVTIQRSDLTQDGFNHMANGHTRWDSVGIDDHVWCYSFNREGQVLLTIGHSTGTLLTVTTSELITDLGNLDRSHLDLDEASGLFIHGETHLVDVALFRMLEWDGPVLELLRLPGLLIVVHSGVACWRDDWGDLSNDDVITTDLNSWANDSIFVKLVIGSMLDAGSLLALRDAELLVVLPSIVVRPVED